MVTLQVIFESLLRLSGGASMIEDLCLKLEVKQPRMYVTNIAERWRMSTRYSTCVVITER